jgi:hypothetical protein
MNNSKTFELIIDVPDYEHEGDCQSWECTLLDELKQNGVTSINSSWNTEYDCECGMTGYVTLSGSKSLENKVNEILDCFM